MIRKDDLFVLGLPWQSNLKQDWLVFLGVTPAQRLATSLPLCVKFQFLKSESEFPSCI